MAKEFDIVVIGGGIAGLSAGLSSARLGRSTLILTGDTLGGLLISIEKIEGYPGFPEGVPGYDLCPMTQEQAVAAGAELTMSTATRIEQVNGRWKIETAGEEYLARAVILAMGTSLKTLGVAGEESLRGKGVSHCASCDAPLLRNRRVVVVGGGDSALQEALTLAEHAAEVVVAHHGKALVAQQSYRARAAAHARINFRPESEVVEILGQDAVTGARFRSTSSGATEDLEAAGVFVYIGLEPCTALVANVVRLSATGHVVTDSAMRASRPGIFAAGTVRAGAAGRAIGAAGDAAAAVIAADAHLKGERS